MSMGGVKDTLTLNDIHCLHWACLALFSIWTWRLFKGFFKAKEVEVCWSLASMGRLMIVIGYKSVFFKQFFFRDRKVAKR